MVWDCVVEVGGFFRLYMRTRRINIRLSRILAAILRLLTVSQKNQGTSVLIGKDWRCNPASESCHLISSIGESMCAGQLNSR